MFRLNSPLFFPRVFPRPHSHVRNPSPRPQPFGDAETKRGACSRASAASLAWSSAHGGELPEYCVGLEGGVGPADSGRDAAASASAVTLATCTLIECFAWMAVLHNTHPASVAAHEGADLPEESLRARCGPCRPSLCVYAAVVAVVAVSDATLCIFLDFHVMPEHVAAPFFYFA